MVRLDTDCMKAELCIELRKCEECSFSCVDVVLATTQREIIPVIIIIIKTAVRIRVFETREYECGRHVCIIVFLILICVMSRRDNHYKLHHVNGDGCGDGVDGWMGWISHIFHFYPSTDGYVDWIEQSDWAETQKMRVDTLLLVL